MGQMMDAGKGDGGARHATLISCDVTRHALRMSSREIAELTGKRHTHVIRDVRAMLDELRDDPDLGHQFSEQKDGRGFTACFHLDRQLSETLITGYSTKLRHRVIQRLHELESQQQGAIALPQTLPDALRLAADLAERNVGLQQLVSEQAPKVQALARLCDAAGSLCLSDAAKHLGMQPKALLGELQERRWVYKRPNSRHWVAYQPRLAAGLLLHKVSVIGRDDSGDDRLASQVRVTPKGLANLAELLGVEVQV